jgi:hypothetical protein
MDNEPPWPLEATDGVEKGRGELGLEMLGDDALMRISASREPKLWRIGSLQSWNGPSDTLLVGDGVIGDLLPWFGETTSGDVGNGGNSSIYHESGAP